MTIPDQALPLWGLQGADVRLVAARENTVYRVDHATGAFALRLHRQGYRSDTQLAAELDWMAWLDGAGLSVPAPRRSLEGPHLQTVAGVQADVLTWLDGDTLDTALPRLNPATRCAVFHQLGRVMAQLHDASDAWPGAAICDRPKWDAEGLLGDAPLWDHFWANPALTPAQGAQMAEFRAKAAADLASRAENLDFGLIHADLVPGNVMRAGEALHLIDFDDGGFGFRAFEVATALLKHRSAPDYDVLSDALLAGYTAHRAFDAADLPLFLALRAATYVGWNITRSAEDATGTRNARFIAQAEPLIATYLAA